MTKMHIASPRAAILYVVCALFTACATGPETPYLPELLSRNTGQDGGACLRTSDVRSYSIHNDEFIFIDASLGSYIVTANPGCQDLGTTPSMAFEGRFKEVCGGGMDKIITRGHHCTIREIFKFDNRNAAIAAYENALDQLREMTDPSADTEK